MKLRQRKRAWPGIIVIPMIDIMFFLLVFFMLSTMYMTNLKTVPVKLSNMLGAALTEDVAFAITIDKDNQYFIGDAKVDLGILQNYAAKELQHNPNAYVVVRTDAKSDYSAFSDLVDALKAAGVAHFGIATDVEKQ